MQSFKEPKDSEKQETFTLEAISSNQTISYKSMNPLNMWHDWIFKKHSTWIKRGCLFYFILQELVKKRQLFRLKSVSLHSLKKNIHISFSLCCVNVTYKTTEAELALPLHSQPSDIKHSLTLLPPLARSLVRLQSSGLRRNVDIWDGDTFWRWVCAGKASPAGEPGDCQFYR